MKRNFHYGENKAQRQARWMQSFNESVVEIDSAHAGRIDWSAANHFYYTGLTPENAAKTYTENRKLQEQSK